MYDLQQAGYGRNYLRVRGEYEASTAFGREAVELPPRARRIPYRLHIIRGRVGTTSACAENTYQAAKTPGEQRNYLRVRGEYTAPPEDRRTSAELPPRARRIQLLTNSAVLNLGTTSACAENTVFFRVWTPIMRNYLRVRGEYSQIFPIASTVVELPPRARRILALGIESLDTHGTTSACAENTCTKA